MICHLLAIVIPYRLIIIIDVFISVGHGKSDGDRVHIEDVQIYVRDVIQHIEIVKAKYSSDIPFFIMGHSMVSLITQNLYLHTCVPIGWFGYHIIHHTKTRSDQRNGAQCSWYCICSGNTYGVL